MLYGVKFKKQETLAKKGDIEKVGDKTPVRTMTTHTSNFSNIFAEYSINSTLKTPPV